MTMSTSDRASISVVVVSFCLAASASSCVSLCFETSFASNLSVRIVRFDLRLVSYSF